MFLYGKQDAVAPALDAFERVVAHRAGRCAADMAAARGGAVDVFVAEIVGAPAQVHILVIGKKQLVEHADLVQDAFAVQRRAAAGRKDAARALVAAGFQPVAALAGKAQQRDIVPGVVGQFGFVIAQHQAAHGKNALVGFGRAQQLGQPLRFGKSVVVEQRDVFAFGNGDALVDRVGKTGVFAVFDQRIARAAAVAARDGKALVGRTVVDDDQLKVRLGLRPDGFDRIPQPPGAV